MFNLNRITQVFREEESGGDADATGGAETTDTTQTDQTTDTTTNEPFYKSLPETWRNDLVNSLELSDDDAAKRLTQLGRVPDFKTLTKNYFESQDKIREGVKPVGLDENSTDEQVAEYREANGIPLTADDYNKGLDEGLVLGDADTRIMSSVFEVAHKANVSSEIMSDITNAMLDARAVEEESIVQQDGLDTQTTRTLLKDNWGSDYQSNLNMIKGLTNQLPESVRDDFMNARLADGKALFNSPEVTQFLVDIARKVNPAGTVVPNSANPTEAIDSEIKTLEGRMGTDEWFKDNKSQERYQQLIEAQNNMRQ